MTETVLGATGALYGWLLTYLLHSAFLLGAVWGLVRAGWVRRPATQDVLWKAAILGSLLTATVGSLRDAPAHQQGRGTVAIKAVAAPSPAVNVKPATMARTSESCTAALESLPEDPTEWPHIVGEACDLPRSFVWQHGVVFLWIFGALLALLGLVRRRRALRDGLGVLAPPGPRARRALMRVAASGADVSARLATSATAGSPCVIGGDTILLPDRCEDQLTDDELEAALAHELAHVHRRDAVWLGLLRLVQATFWMQPLNRVGIAGAVVAAELECDDWAVARTGRPLGLARSLARVAEWSISGARVNAEIALAQGGPRHLSDRVRRILSPAGPEGRGSRWGRVAAALLVLAPAFMLPSVPGAPVVRTAVLYRQQMEDGSGPAFLLLNAVTELGELPADLGAGPFDAETESADRPGG